MNFDEIRWIDFHDNKDDRGRLTAIEEDEHVPFTIKRIFYVHQVKPNTNRGGHAHIDTNRQTYLTLAQRVLHLVAY